MRTIHNLKEVLDGVADFNLYFGDMEVLEELDSIEDLFHEIEVNIYNNFIDDSFSAEWKKSIADESLYFLQGENRVYLKDLIQLVYTKVESKEWHMLGDENYGNYGNG